MQALVRPDVVCASALAAFGTTLASYPRLALWSERPKPLWFLGVLLLLTAFFLWSFVFAWYPQYRGLQPVRLRVEGRDWLLATGLGLLGAAVLGSWVDPSLRPLRPADYPDTLSQWLAGALFNAGFSQLFLCFAPCALFLRLTHKPGLAVAFTVGFGEFLLALQLTGTQWEVGPLFLPALYAWRGGFGTAATVLLLRGGIVPLLWCSLLIECRLLLTL